MILSFINTLSPSIRGIPVLSPRPVSTLSRTIRPVSTLSRTIRPATIESVPTLSATLVSVWTSRISMLSFGSAVIRVSAHPAIEQSSASTQTIYLCFQIIFFFRFRFLFLLASFSAFRLSLYEPFVCLLMSLPVSFQVSFLCFFLCFSLASFSAFLYIAHTSNKRAYAHITPI